VGRGAARLRLLGGAAARRVVPAPAAGEQRGDQQQGAQACAHPGSFAHLWLASRARAQASAGAIGSTAMGERTEYAPGTFSWVDLSTPDPEAAKQFYAALFGWQSQDLPVPGDSFYSMQQLDGKNVAAIAPQPQQSARRGAAGMAVVCHRRQRRRRGAPRGRRRGQRARRALRRVAGRPDGRGPGSAGRLLHGLGAQESIGAELVNVPGALCWNELAASDLDAAPDFYSQLFGWTVEAFEGGPMRYLTIQVAGRSNGGMRETQPQEPPNWLVYFAVEDVEAAMGRVKELGGSALSGPHDMSSVAKIGVVRDPQGAVFALYTGQLEP
jgi:predicted enzyme related to lactoylglutathione lyase